MALLPPLFNAQFFTDDGLPAAGYKLHTYDSGTTTPKTTYTDQAGLSANANPIVLDAAGRCALWLGSGEYTFVLKDAADAVTIWTRDDVAGVPAATTGAYVPLAGGTMTGLLTLSGNAQTALQAVPLQQAQSLIAAALASITTTVNAAVPVGAIAMWLTGSPPTNWLHLNGQAVSRTTYASLFALWGTSYGSGDGSTTFNLPDVRGEFPRFWDSARGVDSGRSLGSAQAAALEAHTHDGVLQAAPTQRCVTLNRADAASANSAIGGNLDDVTGSTGGTETRPRNFSFMAIVKAL